ncbi:MAG: hypothetical protein R3B40_29680 [Polyangiales bacterium]|nr:hypothetical protein [Sandaracinaceae bacterium]
MPTISASPSTIGAPALDIDRLLAHLPADRRAQVKWTRKPFMDAVETALQSPGDVDLLDSASRHATKPITAIMEVVAELLASPEFAVQRASLMSNLEADQRDLSTFVGDPGVVDTLDWCLSFIKGVYREVWSHLAGANWQAALRDAASGEVEETPAAAAFRRGMFALMVASEVSRRGGAVEDAVTLIDIAFLELDEFRQALARGGLIISPFAEETREQRLRRVDTYVTRIRETFTERDFRELDSARFVAS